MAVSINSSVFANYSEEEIENFLRGASFQLANGTIHHDNISTTRKRRWRLTWRAITDTQKETIATQHTNLLAGIGSGAFVDINGISFTVTIPQNRKALTVRTVNANPLRYDVILEIEEV